MQQSNNNNSANPSTQKKSNQAVPVGGKEVEKPLTAKELIYSDVPISEYNLLNFAEIVARCTSRFLSKNDSINAKILASLVNGFAHAQIPNYKLDECEKRKNGKECRTCINCCDEEYVKSLTLSDSVEIVNVAAEQLWKHRADKKEALREARNVVARHIYHLIKCKHEIVNSDDYSVVDILDSDVEYGNPLESNMILREALEEIENELISTEQHIVYEHVKVEYKNSEIAEVMSVSKVRITQHLQTIRKKAKKLFPDGYNSIA